METADLRRRGLRGPVPTSSSFTLSSVSADPDLVRTVVCWKWKAFPGYRSKFEARHVNVFASMIRRNTRVPVEVVCITDDAEGITECDRVIPLWDEFADIASAADRHPGSQKNPSCYRRLRMFRADAAEWLGRRIISMDIDVVVTGDITPILTCSADFAAWGDTNPTTYYNGGLVMLDAGARPQVYEFFKANPELAKQRGRQLKQFGSDQAWLGACLGPFEKKLGKEDGVFSFRNHIQNRTGGRLPPGARLVFFHGHFDPWGEAAQRLPWVRQHWR